MNSDNMTNSESVNIDVSAAAALKKMSIDVFDNTYLNETKNNALILCIDIRNFSNFLRDHDEKSVFALIKEFTTNFLACLSQTGACCSYYKLLGDGAIMIWDENTEKNFNETIAMFNSFSDFLDEYLFKVYSNKIGIAGALVNEQIFKYEISAETSGLKYRDYIGYGINLACRLQTLAEKDELIINQKIAKTGLLPYLESNNKIHTLESLKGLKNEDTAALYIYNREK